MRFMEVGTKFLTKGDKKNAKDMFQKSYQLYSLFWGLNLGVVGVKNAEVSDSDVVNFLGESDKERPEKVGIFEKLGEIVKKAVDCCKE